MDEVLVDWSRAQFALTAIYHFLFVPFVLAYIVYAWYQMDRVKITKDEMLSSDSY